MKNEELLLSNYDLIFNLLSAGVGLQQITNDVNKYIGTQITYRQLRYLIYRVRNNSIHKEYDNIIMIDNLKDAWDTNLGKYCVDFHGLLITYKSAAYLTKSEYIITPNNLATISGKESIIYAKRILKLYHISDAHLLQQHKVIYPKQPDINLTDLVYKINVGFNDDFARMLSDLHDRYINFLTNNIKGIINAK